MSNLDDTKTRNCSSLPEDKEFEEKFKKSFELTKPVINDCKMQNGQLKVICEPEEVKLMYTAPDNQLEDVKFVGYHKIGNEYIHLISDDHPIHEKNSTVYVARVGKVVHEAFFDVQYKNITSKTEETADNNQKKYCSCTIPRNLLRAPLDVRYEEISKDRYKIKWRSIPYMDKNMYILKQYKSADRKWIRLYLDNTTKSGATFKADLSSDKKLRFFSENQDKVSDCIIPNYLSPLHQEPINDKLVYSLISVFAFLVLAIISFIIYRFIKKLMNRSKSDEKFSLHYKENQGNVKIFKRGILKNNSWEEDNLSWNQISNTLYGNVNFARLQRDSLNCDEAMKDIALIPFSNLRFVKYIGCGAFGKVWEGWLHITGDGKGDRFEKVALKVRNNKTLTEDEFKREAALMCRYQHPNIVRFYGISFDSPYQQCLVLEMMELGNLREYLHKARPKCNALMMKARENQRSLIIHSDQSSENFVSGENRTHSNPNSVKVGTNITNTTMTMSTNGAIANDRNSVEMTAGLEKLDLLNIMLDVCKGCEYLEQQKFVHRDIAARNCLVSHNHPSGRIVKLCDFGLARDIYKSAYYRTNNEPKLPVRWMSPEAIKEGLFTVKSDVWAYAVTCWEIMTLGADPFYGRVNLDVMNLVLDGHVLGKPENCPDALYSTFLECWEKFPEMRPSFTVLKGKIEDFINQSKKTSNEFSGPFKVTIPLSKSLQDSSANMMNYGSNSNESQSLLISLDQTQSQRSRGQPETSIGFLIKNKNFSGNLDSMGYEMPVTSSGPISGQTPFSRIL